MIVKDSSVTDSNGNNKIARFVEDTLPQKDKDKLYSDVDEILNVIMSKAMGDHVKACSLVTSLITALSVKIANDSNEMNIQHNIDILSEYMQFIVNGALFTIATEIEDLIAQKKILKDNEKYK